MQIVNLSPFAAEYLVLLDRHGAETLVVVVKGTYDIKNGAVRLHDRQEKIRWADEYNGEPGISSIKYAGEGALFKPATDIILRGSARPSRKNTNQVDVQLRLGKLQKTVTVFGDRHWKRVFGFLRISTPEPFEKVPLVYERAFGGVDASVPERAESEARNPVGVGFRARKSHQAVVGTPLPNLENPACRISNCNQRPGPACLSSISPHWQPRLSHAGTFDEAWQQTRSPLLPEDFAPMFHQTAPADQIYTGYVVGGEPGEVLNASPSGRLVFTLPIVRVRVMAKIASEFRDLEMRLDTVVIDGDDERLLLTWRGSISVHGTIYDVEWIRVSVEGLS